MADSSNADTSASGAGIKRSVRQRGESLAEQMQPIATAALVGGLSAAAVAAAVFLISKRRARK